MWYAGVLQKIDKLLEAILFAFDALPLMVTIVVLSFAVVRGFREIIRWMEELWDHKVRKKQFRLQSTMLRAVIAPDQTQIFKLRSVRAYDEVKSLHLDRVPLEGPGSTDKDRKANLLSYFSIPGRVHEIAAGKGASKNILEIAFDGEGEVLTEGRDHAVLLTYAIKGTLEELYTEPFLTAGQPVGADSLVMEVHLPPCMKLINDSAEVYTVNPKTNARKDVKQAVTIYSNLDLNDGRGPADFIRTTIGRPPQDSEIWLAWKWEKAAKA